MGENSDMENWQQREHEKAERREKALNAIAYTIGLIIKKSPVRMSPSSLDKYLREYADVFYGNTETGEQCIKKYPLPADNNVVQIAIDAGRQCFKKYLREIARPARQRLLMNAGIENQKSFFVKTSLRWIVIDGLTTGDVLDEFVQISLTDCVGRILFTQLIRPRYYHVNWPTDFDVFEITRSELLRNYFSIRRFRPQIQRIIDHAEGILLYDDKLCNLLDASNIIIPETLPIISLKEKFLEFNQPVSPLKTSLSSCADYFSYPWQGYFHDSLANCRAMIYCAEKMGICLGQLKLSTNGD